MTNTDTQTPRTLVALVEAGHFDRLAGAFVPSDHRVTITTTMTRRGALGLQRRARRYGRDLGFSHVRVTQGGVSSHYFTESH